MDTKTKALVRCYDPAIMWGADGTPEREYLDTRDRSLLVLRPGSRLVEYHCVEPSHDVYAWLDEGATEHAKRARAFSACVRRVTYADGRSWTPERASDRGYHSMSTAELSEHAIPDVSEIGQQVIDGVRPFDSPAAYTLPPSSLRALVAAERRSRSAVASQEPTSTPRSSEQGAA